MANNKKPKEDFRDALAAKAKEIVPKFNPADEEFVANIDGEDVKFIRGDMTDREWERIKKQPAAAQRVTVKPAEGSKSPASIAVAVRKPEETDAEWRGRALGYENHPRYDSTVETTQADQREAKREEYKRLIANTAYEGGDGALVSKDELKLLRRMNPDAAADFIEERIRKNEVRAEVERENAKKLKDDPNERPPTVDLGLKKPDQGTPDEWKGNPVTPDGTERTEETRNTPSIRNPASFIPSLVTGATGPTGNPMLNAMADSPPAQALRSVNDAIGPIGLARRFDAAVTDFMRPANEAVVGAAKAANDLLTPQPTPNEQQMAAREDLGLDPLTAEAPLDAKLPYAPSTADPAQVGPGMGPGNVSASLGVKMPSGFKIEKSDPQLMKNVAESAKMAKQAQADFATAQNEANTQRDKMLEDRISHERIVQAEMAKDAQLAIQARQTRADEAARIMGAKTAALAEAEKAAATPTDPNRFWNNKTAGQQAAAVIAGALYGFSGQGMQWLQRIDGLIEADNRLQVADRAAKVAGLQSRAQGLGEAANFAMAQGASEAEAHIIARQMKLEGLNSYLKQFEARTTNLEQKLRAQQMMMELAQKNAGLDVQLAQLGDQQAAQKTEWNYKNAAMRADAFKAAVSMSGKMGGEQVRGPQAMELGALAAASKVAQDLKAQFGEKNFISRFLDKGAALFPGTDATKYNLARAQAVNMIAPMMGAGVLQAHDLKRWEELMAKAGDLNGEAALDILVNDISRLYNEKRGALEAAGFRTGNFPVMGGSVNFTPMRN